MDSFSALVQSLCITWEKHSREGLRNFEPWLYCFEKLSLRALKAFLYLWLPRGNHFQFYVNTTALCKNAASGTQIISICGRVFSCLLLQHKTSCRESQCDMEENMDRLQNPCAMHRLIYTHPLVFYKELCVPLPYFVSQPIWHLEQGINIPVVELV